MWTVDVGLGCLVVELLTSTVGVLDLIPGPAIYVFMYPFQMLRMDIVLIMYCR